MSIRHLDQLFDPASVAVIGASQRPASVGATVWRNLHAGGVVLDLSSPDDVHRSAHAQELIVGATIDSVFGPVILFGQGGTAVEVLADRAIALPPLNRPLARALGFHEDPTRSKPGFCLIRMEL